MSMDFELDILSNEILALETETFSISDYADVTEAVLASCSTSSSTSTCSSTCSSTSCSSCTSTSS
jgi:thiazolylpeptide-type bacteriocin precursor